MCRYMYSIIVSRIVYCQIKPAQKSMFLYKNRTAFIVILWRKVARKLSIWISYSLRLFHERPLVISVRWRVHVLWRHLPQQTSIASVGCFINYSSINHSFHYFVGNKMQKWFPYLNCLLLTVRTSKKNYDPLMFCTLKKIQKKNHGANVSKFLYLRSVIPVIVHSSFYVHRRADSLELFIVLFVHYLHVLTKTHSQNANDKTPMSFP